MNNQESNEKFTSNTKQININTRMKVAKCTLRIAHGNELFSVLNKLKMMSTAVNLVLVED